MLSNPVSCTLGVLTRIGEGFASRLLQLSTFQLRPLSRCPYSTRYISSPVFGRRHNFHHFQGCYGFSPDSWGVSFYIHGCRNMTVLANVCSSRETNDLRARTGIIQSHKHFQSAAAVNSSAYLLCRTLSCVFQPVDTVSLAGGDSALIHKGHPTSLSHCVVPVRHKSGGKKSQQNDEDEESDEEELTDDDYEAPLNFKKMKIHLKSLRADSVVSSALDISRNRVDEIFFGSRLRLNGEKLLKKSKQMSEGDYVDVVVERSAEEDKLLVKRVKVISVSSERTNKDKLVVIVKVWKSAFPIEDTSKSDWK
ncbi:uncharacterized protein [Littorina saxatilis]|uniref:uncharacterized protein n=1 Tax=Littorina saxatilis TaxID=31220 RepID=UPI0038B67914